MDVNKKFTVRGVGESEGHEYGNPNCGECYFKPSVCKKCGGLIHNAYFDESWDSIMLDYQCDKCGSKDEPED